jgi:hypothetical protein
LGDQVVVSKGVGRPKLKHTYDGPYVVVAVNSKGSYKVQKGKGKAITLNARNLKHYTERNPEMKEPTKDQGLSEVKESMENQELSKVPQSKKSAVKELTEEEKKIKIDVIEWLAASFNIIRGREEASAEMIRQVSYLLEC